MSKNKQPGPMLYRRMRVVFDIDVDLPEPVVQGSANDHEITDTIHCLSTQSRTVLDAALLRFVIRQLQEIDIDGLAALAGGAESEEEEAALLEKIISLSGSGKTKNSSAARATELAGYIQEHLGVMVRQIVNMEPLNLVESYPCRVTSTKANNAAMRH